MTVKVDYDHLTNVILQGLMRTQPPGRVPLATANVEPMIGFVSFMEDMQVKCIVGTAAVLSQKEKAGEIVEGETRKFIEHCVSDLDNNLRVALRIGAKMGALPFDPFAQKTHNEKLAEELLQEIDEHSDDKSNVG